MSTPELAVDELIALRNESDVAPETKKSMVVNGDEALRWILSTLPPVSAMRKARFAIAPGFNF